MKISNIKYQISNKYQLKRLKNWKFEIGIIGNSLQSKAGFTLLELIVSIGVLAVLSTFLLAAVNPFEQFQKAEDSRRKSDLSQIQKSLEAYYQDTGAYPSSNGDYDFSTNDIGDPIKTWGDNWSPYMVTIPADKGSKEYVYYSDPVDNGQSYRIYTSLDRGSKDLQSCAAQDNVKADGITCTGVPDGVFCGGTYDCNYGVSSPNVSP
jgi:prepilin-type N-terminal cleavage/methylation domain-containing protein